MSVNDIWLTHQCSMNWILNIKLKLWWLKSHHIGWGGLLYLLYTISYTYQGSGSTRNMLQCLLVPNVIALLLLSLFYTVWSEPLSKQYTCKKRNTLKLLEPVPVFDQQVAEAIGQGIHFLVLMGCSYLWPTHFWVQLNITYQHYCSFYSHSGVLTSISIGNGSALWFLQLLMSTALVVAQILMNDFTMDSDLNVSSTLHCTFLLLFSNLALKAANMFNKISCQL